jgi:hypothetical protein
MATFGEWLRVVQKLVEAEGVRWDDIEHNERRYRSWFYGQWKPADAAHAIILSMSAEASL